MRNKTTFLLTAVIVSAFIFATSCVTPTALEDPAERYIKTQVEKHDSAELSSVRIFPLVNMLATNCSTELQMTAYKYDGAKQLVICIRPYHMAGSNKVYDSLEIVELNVEEVRAIADNYRVLEEKILLEKPVPGEYVYHDYTVNEHVFLSYRGTLNPVLKRVIQSLSIDLWINSTKYTVSTNELLNKIQVFLSY
jgi:hypothetical protein